MKNQENYTQKQIDAIIELYVNQERGQAFVCKQVKTSPTKLKKFLQDNGYKIRNFSEAASASNKNRAKNKNFNYFKTETSSMAWLLGFLASDGSISKKDNEIKIGLSVIDIEILEKIKNELELETKVKTYTTNQGFECAKLSWCCEEHKKDLEKYSIIPAKTFILKPPYKLDKKYWIDYIRGYFDGDGSISYITTNKALRWQVCSATPEILNFIVNFFYEEYNIPKVNLQSQKDKNLYCIQYSTNATKEIYKHLYTNEALFLKRKKDKYEEILKKVNS